MAITAPVVDGVLQQENSGKSSNEKKVEKNNGLDKDAFLQLLVAQMRYQDPLQPTSNTEYISQLATFSQLEETQNLANTTAKQHASDLIGKRVIMKTVSTITGETGYMSGKVDFVYIENGKSYLSIQEALYPIEDLDTVIDEDYLDAINLSKDFENMIDKLPAEKLVTLNDKASIEEARKKYDGMTDYQKKYVSTELVDTLKALESKIAELEKEAGVGEGEGGSGEGDTGEGGNTEGEK